MIKHYPTCRADYPEKTPGERPQATTDIDLEDGTVARTCNDCGAFEIVSKPVPIEEVFPTLGTQAEVDAFAEADIDRRMAEAAEEDSDSVDRAEAYYDRDFGGGNPP